MPYERVGGGVGVRKKLRPPPRSGRPPEGRVGVGGGLPPPIGWPDEPAGGAAGKGLPAADPNTGKPKASAEDPLIDFDALLKSDPRVIASEAALKENIHAANLAKEAAIKKAMIALGLSQEDIARAAGFRQADLGANLAGRGMLMSGGYGGGTQRIESERAMQLAEANRTSQDTIGQAISTEADLIRQFNQDYQKTLADAAAALAADPRYQPKPKPQEEPGTTTTKPPPEKPAGQKPSPPPPSKPPPSGQVPKKKKKKSWLEAREKAGRM